MPSSRNGRNAGRGRDMKIIIAPDSFKGCMSARQAAEAMEHGVHHVLPDAECVLVPMADGGEGTVQSLVDATGGTLLEATVTGPLGMPVHAQYGMLGDGCTAVIEMAAASGIGYVDETTRDPRITTTYGVGELILDAAQYGMLGDGCTAVIEMAAASGIGYVDETTRDPRITTTYGVGELILDALDHGATAFILGLGGSATNDGGAGMAQALGAHLLDAQGNELSFGGAALAGLAAIDVSDLDSRIAAANIRLASDVTNPLTGPQGASSVFGPQKGADASMVAELDAALHRYASIVARDLGRDVETVPGAGAAGGLGAGFLAFTGARMQSGVSLVVEATGLKTLAAVGRDVETVPGAGAAGGLGAGFLAFTGARMQSGVSLVVEATGLKTLAAGADWCFTGEGGIDSQTQYGKTPIGVARALKEAAPHCPVVAFAGNVGSGVEELYSQGIDAVFGIVPGPQNLRQALACGAENLERCAANVTRLIACMRGMTSRA